MQWQFWALVWAPVLAAVGFTIAGFALSPGYFVFAGIAGLVALCVFVWAGNALNTDI